MRARNRHRVFALPHRAAPPSKSFSIPFAVPPGKFLGNRPRAYIGKCSNHKGKARGKGAAHTVLMPKIRAKGARRVTYASSGLEGTQYRAQGIIQQGRGGHGQVGTPPTKVVWLQSSHDEKRTRGGIPSCWHRQTPSRRSVAVAVTRRRRRSRIPPPGGHDLLTPP